MRFFSCFAVAKPKGPAFITNKMGKKSSKIKFSGQEESRARNSKWKYTLPKEPEILATPTAEITSFGDDGSSYSNTCHQDQTSFSPGEINKRYKYAKFREDAMKKAVSLVNNGMSLRKASKECHIAFQTLARYVKKAAIDKDAKMTPNYTVNQIFSSEQEKELVELMINCSNMFYGLRKSECRKLAYEMAVFNNMLRPKNWDVDEMAGLHWFKNFCMRHPNLFRNPESSSSSSATSFNRHDGEKFFQNLKDALSRSPTCFESGYRIYNMDDICLTTSQTPRETIVTTCCTVNAKGQFIPPVMVFPCTHFKESMIRGAPYGTLGLVNPSGLMNSSCFVDVINHFIKFTKSSQENPTLLIMDNHESHINVAALNLAKANGISILTVPPHSTNKLQPLKVGVYEPFKKAYNAAVDSYMMQNPGKTYNMYNVAAAVGYALDKSMLPFNIVASFKKTGIFPFNGNVFDDVDFLSSFVTDGSEPVLNIQVDPAPMSIKPELQTIGENISSTRGHSEEKVDTLPNPDVFHGFQKAISRSNQRKEREKTIKAKETQTKLDIKEREADRSSNIKSEECSL